MSNEYVSLHGFAGQWSEEFSQFPGDTDVELLALSKQTTVP
jgi:hypothetical protein